MRPISLTLAGLRSYRQEQTIQFGQAGLFAVVGETGAGKSSILEAITYALYNATTWDERNVRALLADGMQTMSVTLVFDADGRRYRITRSTSINNYPPAVHLLEELSERGQGNRLRLDKEAQIRGEIKRIIGLDYEGFRTAVVLPQGRFQTLLLARPAEKTAILKGILRLDELERVRNASLEAAGSFKNWLRGAEAQRARLLPDPERELEAARQGVLVSGRREEELARARVRMGVLKERREEAERRKSGARARITRLGEVNLADKAQVQSLQRLAIELDQREAKVGVEMDSQREALRNLDQTLEGSNEGGLGEKLSQLAELRRLGNGEGKAVLTAREAELRDAQNGLRESLGQEAQLGAKLVLEKAGLSEAQEKAEANRRRLGGLEVAAGALEMARGAAGEMGDRVEALKAKLAAAESKVRAADENLLVASRAGEVARKRAEQIGKADMASLLRKNLKTGKTCPVCLQKVGQVPTASPHQHRAVDLDEVRRAETAANLAANGARVELAEVKGEWLAAEGEMGRQREAVKIAENDLVSEGGEIGVEVEGLAAARIRVGEALELVTTRQAAVSQQSFEMERISGEVRHQQLGLERREAEVAGLREQEAGRAGRALELSRLVLGLEREARTEEIEGAQREVEGQMMEFKRLRGERAAGVDNLARQQEQRREIESQRRVEVDSEMGRLRENLARVEEICGIRLGEWSQIGEADDKVAEAEAGLAAARTEAEQSLLLAEGVEAEVAVGETNELRQVGLINRESLDLALIEVKAEKLNFEQRVARGEVELPQVRKLEGLMGPIRERIAALEETAQMVTDARFVRFVVARKEIALLGLASHLLGNMTGGRLGFATGFSIAERGSGMPRDARTLSGGELFLASLALALGLVEMAGREGGRLGAIFLDEGFGSLDASTLDEALGALEEVAAKGRMVAVVSHLRAVAERIEQVLAVKRGNDGSSLARWVTPNERNSLIIDELEAGLLQ